MTREGRHSWASHSVPCKSTGVPRGASPAKRIRLLGTGGFQATNTSGSGGVANPRPADIFREVYVHAHGIDVVRSKGQIRDTGPPHRSFWMAGETISLNKQAKKQLGLVAELADALG